MKHRHRLALTLTLAVAAAAGCGDSTGNALVRFRAQGAGVERDVSEPLRFTNDQGWAVTLTEARMALGPVYLNTVPPLEARRWRAPSIDRLLPALGDLLIAPAWADGSDQLGAGRVVAQVTSQVEVDLLSPTPVPFTAGGDGTSDPARSAEVWLYNRSSLRDAAVRVAGVARKDDVEVPFAGAVVADASLVTSSAPLDVARRVRGIPVDITAREGGTLTLRVDPRPWFRGASFDALTANPVDAEGRHPFTPADNVGRAVLNNVRLSRGVYALTFAP